MRSLVSRPMGQRLEVGLGATESLGICGHPHNRCFRLRQGVLVGSEDLARVTMERKPPSQILGIPAVLLETERAIVASENINAMIARGVVEGCYDMN